jgi:hypothetical protein
MSTFDIFNKSLKKFSLVSLLMLSGMMVSIAQEEATEPATKPDTKAQEKIKDLRIAYISDKLGLTPQQAEKFWPVYREFVQERAKLRTELKAAQLNAGTADQQKQQQIIDLGLKIKQQELDLEKKYSGQLLQVINAQQMLNLHKAEQEFRAMIINQLQQRRLMQQRKENFRDNSQLLQQRRN